MIFGRQKLISIQHNNYTKLTDHTLQIFLFKSRYLANGSNGLQLLRDACDEDSDNPKRGKTNCAQGTIVPSFHADKRHSCPEFVRATFVPARIVQISMVSISHWAPLIRRKCIPQVCAVLRARVYLRGESSEMEACPVALPRETMLRPC